MASFPYAIIALKSATREYVGHSPGLFRMMRLVIRYCYQLYLVLRRIVAIYFLPQYLFTVLKSSRKEQVPGSQFSLDRFCESYIGALTIDYRLRMV
jgi:hypothetical protein